MQLQQLQGRERGLNPARVFGLRLLPEHLQGLTCLSWHLVSPAPGSVQPRAGVRERASQLSGSQLPLHVESLVALPHSPLPETPSHLIRGETRASGFPKSCPSDIEVQPGRGDTGHTIRGSQIRITRNMSVKSQTR